MNKDMNYDAREIVSTSFGTFSNVDAFTCSNPPSSRRGSSDLPTVTWGHGNPVIFVDMRLPNVLEDVMGSGMSPMFSCCPQVPSIALSSREASVEGRVASHCVTNFATANRSGEGVCAAREREACVNPHKSGGSAGDTINPRCTGIAEDGKQMVRLDSFGNAGRLHSTSASLVAAERPSAQPAGTLTSAGASKGAPDRNASVEKQLQLSSQREEAGIAARINNVTVVEGQRPPLSFMLTGEKAAKRRHRRHRVATTAVAQRSSLTKKLCTLGEGSYTSGDLSELSVSPIVAIDQRCCGADGDGVTQWKRRCLFAEQQLAVAVQCLWEYHNVFLEKRREEVSTNNLSTVKRVSPAVDASAPLMHLEERRRQVEEVLDDVEGVLQMHGRHWDSGKGAHMKSLDVKNGPLSAESVEYGVQRYNAAQCCPQEGVAAACPDDWAVSNEVNEAKSIARADEWLAREKVMRLKQELLATALRQARLTAMRTMQRIEEREEQFKAMASKCDAAQTALFESEAVVREMKVLDEKRMKENKHLQRKLNKLRTQLEGCGAAADWDDTCLTDSFDSNGGHSILNMSVSQCQDVETQLLHVIAALQCGESRREWVAHQLTLVLKRIKNDLRNKEAPAIFGPSKISMLVDSLRALIHSRDVTIGEGCEPFSTSPMRSPHRTQSTLKGHEGTAELLYCAQEYVTELGKWMADLQENYLALREKVDAGSAEKLPRREEDPPTQCYFGRAEGGDEKLHSAPMSRAESQPSACSELLATRERLSILRSVYSDDLLRLQKHMEWQLHEFSHTLYVKLTEATKWLGHEQLISASKKREDPVLLNLKQRTNSRCYLEEQKENRPTREVIYGSSASTLGIPAAAGGEKKRHPGLFLQAQAQSSQPTAPSPVPGTQETCCENTSRSLSTSPLRGRLTLPPFILENLLNPKSTTLDAAAPTDVFVVAGKEPGTGVAVSFNKEHTGASELSPRHSASSHGRRNSLCVRSCDVVNKTSPRALPLSQGDPNLAGRWATVRVHRR